jgi:hypothetical protein
LEKTSENFDDSFDTSFSEEKKNVQKINIVKEI